MFNFHMVRCLNLLSKLSIRNSSTYAYIYSHRPTYKVRSVLRDQLKILPDAIGHFAELGTKHFQIRNKNQSFRSFQITSSVFR